MRPLPKVGFIGLGAMGQPMATCLINAGYPVLGNDLNRSQFATNLWGHA